MSRSSPTDLTLMDGIGRSVSLAEPATRVVSLVPSTTESLAVLGRGDTVVGRTRFCVHPMPWVESVPEVGGTKSPDLGAIAELAPDLILANQEENLAELWEPLGQIAPLWVAAPTNVDEALADLRAMAVLLGAEHAASVWCEKIEHARRAVHSAARPFRFAYMVWRAPWMAVNSRTYISALLAEAGGENVFADRSARYPVVTLDELKEAAPDVVLLPSEPFPFALEHTAEFEELGARCRFVDGELLCWHGTRMAAGFPYLGEFLAEGLPS
jgi:ABC-type Fe3+-hydroxamate transport system substrate-binding protein